MEQNKYTPASLFEILITHRKISSVTLGVLVLIFVVGIFSWSSVLVKPEVTAGVSVVTVDPTDGRKTYKDNKDCGITDNSSFKSVNKHESGLSVDGPVMGYWLIVFDKVGLVQVPQNGGVTWFHSDVAEAGTYSCEEIAGESMLSIKFITGRSLSAKYNPTRDSFLVQGNEGDEYIKVPAMASDISTRWRTYKNEKYGFEFKYPSGWKLTKYEIEDAVEVAPTEGLGHNIYFYAALAYRYLPGQFDLNSYTKKSILVDGMKAEEYTPKEGDGPSSIFILYKDQWYKIEIWRKIKETDEILSTFKFTDSKESTFDEFKKLTDWQTSRLVDWAVKDWDLVGPILQKYSSEKVFLLSKSFNEKSLSGSSEQITQELQQEGDDEQALEIAVRKVLFNNGWKLTLSPKEGGFYQDFIYTKNNKPLVLEIGTREAVTGGMYVMIEFQY